MAGFAYPFLRIDPDNVIATPWEQVRNGTSDPLPAYMSNWDYASYTRLRRTLKVNMLAVATSLGFDAAELKLNAVVTLGTGGSAGADRYSDLYWSSEIIQDEPEREIEFTLEGSTVSQRFTLRTELLLGAPVDSGGPLSPKRKGLRLWEETVHCWVEPREPRFPVESLSFRSSLPNSENALWMLEWSPGPLTDDFDGAFRLLLNEDDPEFISRMTLGDATTLRLILGAVRVQIVRGALANESFVHGAEERAGVSVAAAVSRWLQQAFPDQDVDTIRQIANLNPSQFDTAIAALDMHVGL